MRETAETSRGVCRVENQKRFCLSPFVHSAYEFNQLPNICVICVLLEPSKNPIVVKGNLVRGLYFPSLSECVKKKWLDYGWTSS